MNYLYNFKTSKVNDKWKWNIDKRGSFFSMIRLQSRFRIKINSIWTNWQGRFWGNYRKILQIKRTAERNSSINTATNTRQRLFWRKREMGEGEMMMFTESHMTSENSDFPRQKCWVKGVSVFKRGSHGRYILMSLHKNRINPPVYFDDCLPLKKEARFQTFS